MNKSKIGRLRYIKEIQEPMTSRPHNSFLKEEQYNNLQEIFGVTHQSQKSNLCSTETRPSVCGAKRIRASTVGEEDSYNFNPSMASSRLFSPKIEDSLHAYFACPSHLLQSDSCLGSPFTSLAGVSPLLGMRNRTTSAVSENTNYSVSSKLQRCTQCGQQSEGLARNPTESTFLTPSTNKGKLVNLLVSSHRLNSNLEVRPATISLKFELDTLVGGAMRY